MDELSKNGDPLEKFNEYVPWEEFRSELEVIRKTRTDNVGGRPPFDVVLMMKLLVFQCMTAMFFFEAILDENNTREDVLCGLCIPLQEKEDT